MAAIFVVVLGLVIYAHYIYTKTSQNNIHSVQVHNEINHSLIQVNNILQILEKKIYEQSIIPDKDLAESIEQTYDILLAEIIKLTKNEVLLNYINKDTNSIHSNYMRLNNLSFKTLLEIEGLRLYIVQLNHLSANYFERYPVMSLYENQVLPINKNIQTAIELSLESEGKENLTMEQSNSIKSLYMDARYAWSKHIHYVRLFIANRFGTFGQRRENSTNNLSNRKLYYSYFQDTINRLKEHQKKNHLDLFQEKYLNSIIELLPKYNVSFNQAKDIHLSKGWRKDLVLLETKLRPQLDKIWEQIINMQKIVNEQFNESISQSLSTTRKFSIIIWLSALTMLLTLFSIYFVFEYSLRRPIAKVAKALDDEASGKENVNITGSFTKEINHLLNAFSNMRKQVHSRQSRLQSILDNAFEGIIITNEDGIIESFNKSAQLLFEYSEDEIIGHDVSLIINLPDTDTSLNYTHNDLPSILTHAIGKKTDVIGIKNGNNIFPISIKTNEIWIDGALSLIASIEDISERKALIDDLEFQAMHDSLTSLYNRRYFIKELDEVINQYIRGTSNQHGVIYIDLDNFKYVNDTMGHIAGDQLIIEIAQLLHGRIRETDVLSRLGGDEFAIILYHDKNIHLDFVAESFRKLVSDYIFKYQGNIVDISCSIGGAYLNDDVETKEQLLARADFACHESKRLGRNRSYIYSKKDDSQVSDMSRDIGWARRIKDALLNDNFLLACQPIYDTKEDTISYYEILIRMVESNDQIIMPFGFLPAAERFGLMTDIDAWVVRNSIKLLAKQQQFNPDLKFSINLSAHSIDNNATYDLIKDEIERHGVDPASILFEVTETIAIANLNVAQKLLYKIQDLGCKTALDDFGVGYSSFAYLADLPVDIVKIDGFFVKDMETKHLNKIMVRSINDIAHALGKTTVAEFVENEKIYLLLKQLNVDYAQGYHLGKPVIIYDDSKPIEAEPFDNKSRQIT